MFSIYRIFSYRSNSIIPWVFALVIVPLGLMSYELSDLYDEPSDTKVKYCGKDLREAMRRVCRDNYNSFGDNMHRENPGYAVRSKATARSMIKRFSGSSASRFRRHGIGIYHECCVKPCREKELSSYCGY